MEFDTPSPQQKSGHDYSKNPLKEAIQIEYKTGKLETASVKMYFDGKLDPEYQTQGFRYWDRVQKERIGIGSFTAYVIGIYSGSFSNGKDRGDLRYFSNLVNDTRTDVIQSCYWGTDRSIQFALGNYQADIKPAFEALSPKRTSTYTKVLVVYIAERKEVCEIHLNATLEAGLCKAIAKARGIEEYKATLFGLTDLLYEIWVFQFKGEFEPVAFSPKDAKKVPETIPAKKEDNVLYFQPIFIAGVLRADNPKYTERVASINAMQGELSDYIASEQAHLKAQMSKCGMPAPQESNAQRGAFTDAVQAYRNDDPFPTQAPPPTNEDDLPF
jgi:hypothetical protein